MPERANRISDMSTPPGIVPIRRNGREWCRSAHRSFCSVPSKTMKIDQTERCADRHHSRPFRRMGTIPGGVDISGKHSPRPAIQKCMVAAPTNIYCIFCDLDTYVVLFCTEIGELQMVIAGASTGKIWIQEGLSPPENVPPQPGLVPIRRNSREGCFAPQGSK